MRTGCLLQFNRSELRDFCVYTRPLSIIFRDIDVGLSRVIIRSVVVHMLRGMACRIPAVLLVFYFVSELCRQYFNVSNIFDVDTVKIRDDYASFRVKNVGNHIGGVGTIGWHFWQRRSTRCVAVA